MSTMRLPTIIPKKDLHCSKRRLWQSCHNCLPPHGENSTAKTTNWYWTTIHHYWCYSLVRQCGVGWQFRWRGKKRTLLDRPYSSSVISASQPRALIVLVVRNRSFRSCRRTPYGRNLEASQNSFLFVHVK